MNCRNCEAELAPGVGTHGHGYCKKCKKLRLKIRVIMRDLLTEIKMTGLSCFEAAGQLKKYADSIGWKLINVDYAADDFARGSDTQGDY